jgi:hypothetical protein
MASQLAKLVLTVNQVRAASNGDLNILSQADIDNMGSLERQPAQVEEGLLGFMSSKKPNMPKKSEPVDPMVAKIVSNRQNPQSRVPQAKAKVYHGYDEYNRAKAVGDVEETANPAQQAAIAIAMKKAGKKPKHVDENDDWDDGEWADDAEHHVVVKAQQPARYPESVLRAIERNPAMRADIIADYKRKQQQGVAEGHADQERKIFKKNGKPVGEVGIDRESSPGNGQWYMTCYGVVSYGGYDSYEEAVAELKHCLKQGVAEGGYSNYDNNRTGFGRRGREDDEYHVPDPVETKYNIKVNGQVINQQPFANRAAALAWAKKAVAAGKLDPKNAKLSPINQVNELSNEKLGQYKQAAALDAGAADRAGNFERGDKRFAGIIKATKKQFANDIKKHPVASKGLNEFAPAGGSGAGDYFRALASAWYNGAFNTGSLGKGIKSQQDVERLLQRGVLCPDGVTRKFGIDYNSDFDGVVISSDDYYEHADYNDQGQEVDSRTGQKWGPYDYMEFLDSELDESVAPTDYSKRRQRERDVDSGRPVKALPKNPQTDYARKRAKEKRDLEQFGEEFEMPGTTIPQKSIIRGYVVYYNPQTQIVSITRRGDSEEAAIEQARLKTPSMLGFETTVSKLINRIEQDLVEDGSTSSDAVERAILNRIMVAHTDLLMQFGPDKVMQAAEEVAYNVGDVDEIGTSDVSAYVNQVKQILGVA